MSKFSLIMFLLLFISCETFVEYEIPFEKPDVVVNSMLNPDSVISVNLSESIHILDMNFNLNPFPAVTNANVQIFENDNLLGNMNYLSDGKYLLQEVYPKSGSQYRIEVDVPDYDNITSDQEIPIENFNFNAEDIKVIPGEYEFDLSMDLNLVIEDPKGANYYSLIFALSTELYDYSTDPPTFIEEYTQNLYFSTEDPSLNGFIDNNSTHNLVFDDEIFDGKSYTLPIFIEYLPYFRENPDSDIRFTIILKNLSRESYLYNRSMELQSSTDGNPFTEPVPVFTNIENGLGIFGSYSQKEKEYIIELK